MSLDQDGVIRVRKIFTAPVAAVYELCAGEDFFDFCGVDVDSGTIDFKVGGEYSYTVDDDDYLRGAFRAIEPNARIAFTWLTMGLDGPTGETLVTLTFHEEDGRCHVALEHSGLTHRKTAKAHDEAWVEIFEAIGEELADTK